jgi:hypothetical protein
MVAEHTYLFTLEIVPLETDKLYEELPAHLTLMSRFQSELSPDELASAVQYVFAQTSSVSLIFSDREEFGPKRITAYMIESPQEIVLHSKLHQKLSALQAVHLYPQFVGTGHKAHVSIREEVSFRQGERTLSSAAYLIEVVNRRRLVRSRFELGSIQ